MGMKRDMRVYFDMDGTIAKWRDVPVEETRKPGYYAELEKKKWLDRYLPEIDSAHCLFVPYGKTNKAEFLAGMLHRRLNKADILIDDHTPNLQYWEKAGGLGVKWLNGINGKKGCFEGARVGSAKELRAVLDSAVERKAAGF